MKEFCSSRKPAKPIKPAKPAKPVSKKTLKRKVPDCVRRAIVFLVYGKGGTFVSKIRSYSEVARIFTMSRKTVWSVIEAFKREGCPIEEFRDRRFDRRSCLDAMDPAVKRELLR